MQDVFGLHELAVEDAQSFHLRPKVEQYDERHRVRRPAHRALRARARGGRVRRDLDLPRRELRDHRPPGRGERPARRAAAARGSARSCCARGRSRRCGRSSTRSSTTTRRSSRSSSATSRRSSRPSSPARIAPVQRIYLLRREVSDFYRAVHPLLAPVSALARGDLLDVTPPVAPVLPRRQRPPQPRQRGDRRPARPAHDDPAGEHGGDRRRSSPTSCARSRAGRRSSPCRRSSRRSTG